MVQIFQAGPLRARVSGGTDGRGGGDGPLVVLLHGFGAPGGDLVGLEGALPQAASARFIFPEAPLELPFGFGDSRAWWMIDIERFQRARTPADIEALTAEVPRGLKEAREALAEFLERVERHFAPSGGQIVLGGFSQGSMMALDQALMTERRFAGLLLFSSSLIARSTWLPQMTRTAGWPILQSHGSADPVLPLIVGEQLRDALVAHQAAHVWFPFPGGHELPGPLLSRADTFLGSLLKPQTP